MFSFADVHLWCIFKYPLVYIGMPRIILCFCVLVFLQHLFYDLLRLYFHVSPVTALTSVQSGFDSRYLLFIKLHDYPVLTPASTRSWYSLVSDFTNQCLVWLWLSFSCTFKKFQVGPALTSVSIGPYRHDSPDTALTSVQPGFLDVTCSLLRLHVILFWLQRLPGLGLL